MQYNVHIYPVVRVRVDGVEAGSQQEAIDKAERGVDLYGLLLRDNPIKQHTDEYEVAVVEYADNIDGFVVDEVSDEEYRHTGHYDKHGALMFYEGGTR